MNSHARAQACQHNDGKHDNSKCPLILLVKFTITFCGQKGQGKVLKCLPNYTLQRDKSCNTNLNQRENQLEHKPFPNPHQDINNGFTLRLDWTPRYVHQNWAGIS